MARKKVEKAPLSPKEAASKEFAMTSCVHSGDPSYRFEVGDSVSIGALKNCVVDEVCEDGKYYGIKYGKDGACYGYWSWLDVRPIPTSLEAKYTAMRPSFSTTTTGLFSWQSIAMGRFFLLERIGPHGSANFLYSPLNIFAAHLRMGGIFV